MTNAEDFLAHYGVQGMKWGQRRARASENVELRSLRRKRASQLSDADIKKAINRMQLEKQYRDLNPKGLSKANKAVLGILALGTTVNSVYAFAKSDFGKSVISFVKDKLGK